ncbi:MAG: hypothetical protein M3043_02885 [Lysinibacillus fusiformis]|nr:hypothetical protein [Lysinibacillus fusiformis]MCT6927405.1 hypothetical protein [Lysinibacillus fusiformis]MCT6931741.1 hypothetical protein [Lysinibacillus fusiformis]
MRSHNGIPIDIPAERKRAPKVNTQKPAEYNHYNVYVTMFKREGNQNIWTMVPFMHPDYKKLRKEGYRITDKWDKREVSA